MMGAVAISDGIDRFPSLPEELIKLIFEHACIAHPDPKEPSDSRTNTLDVKTTLRLMQVSRASHSLVVPVLYRSVTISRPSQLMALAATLLARPSLGLLVRNLWVGSLQSPSMSYLPCIISDVELAVAARSHIDQYVHEHGSSPSRKLHHMTAADLVYVEAGAEYAAMHVPPKRDRLVEPIGRTDAVADHSSSLDTASVHSAASTADADTLQDGYGVDRASLGYDAAGEWIGMDEWMLRCLELQRAIEFHWEWVGVTCSSNIHGETEEDRAAKETDPLDWADASNPIRALPSRIRQISADTMASSSTTEYLRSGASSIGFQHLRNFFHLRENGHSPQSAAKLLIGRYLQSVTANGLKAPEAADVCNLFLMADAREEDHFLHPALFARSGAIHLIVPAEPPEGLNAPPNAIPATTAAASYLHDLGHASSDDSSDDERRDGRSRSTNEEGRHRTTPSQPLDFVDLFGHIPHSTRTLYSGPRIDDGDDSVMFSQTLKQEDDGFAAMKAPRRLMARPRMTLGGLLANLRAVMSMCPRIKVLGLNGFLERAVCGTRECAGLTELRHLSLGPPPPFWSSALNLHQPTLSSLRTLHISGCMLFRSEAMALGGFTDALPRLREIDWTLWLGHALEHPINVVEALSYLTGREVPPAVGARTSRTNGVRRRKPLRKIRATLNGEDIAFWRRHAGPESLNDPRLVLRECTSRDTDVNLQAVRLWWEAKAGLI